MIRTGFALALAAGLLAGCGQNAQQNTETTAPQATSDTTAPPAPQSADAKRLLASLPAPYDTGDIENGHRVFARCQVCHSTVEGGPNLIGPNLWGIFGRKVASKADFSYSDALKAKGGVWDAAGIDHWIASPRTVAPGTKMSFAGLPDPKDRIDVVAYLKTATSK